jgi:acetyl-CoA carboxylase biotin carboxylase subunit
MCEKCMVKFIGPGSDVIDRMGNKSEARNTMIAAGVPVVPGSKQPILEVKPGEKVAEEIGYPVMIKAASGGGGRGMRVAQCREDFEGQFMIAQREAEKGFSDPTMYIERYVKNPRHIEFQILADAHGHVVHLGERDCSVQRRHQKMIEESPSPAISEELRQAMGEAAVKAAAAAGYENAGTIEFLLDQDHNFYFIEMNTRIQVEHPVTEAVTGIDLIKEQIRIAAGEALPYTQKDVVLRGHAMECRINAENAEKNFMPCPGTITDSHFPGGFGVRVDSAIYNGYKIPPFYDSMIAKLIVHGVDRKEALQKMEMALREFSVEGVITNLEYQLRIIDHPVFQEGKQDTSFIEQYL